jgi:hypothetical protein
MPIDKTFHYLDGKGKKIVLCTGIDGALWGVFRVKTDIPYSTSRVKQIEMNAERGVVADELHAYAEKNKWKMIATPLAQAESPVEAGSPAVEGMPTETVPPVAEPAKIYGFLVGPQSCMIVHSDGRLLFELKVKDQDEAQTLFFNETDFTKEKLGTELVWVKDPASHEGIKAACAKIALSEQEKAAIAAGPAGATEGSPKVDDVCRVCGKKREEQSEGSKPWPGPDVCQECMDESIAKAKAGEPPPALKGKDGDYDFIDVPVLRTPHEEEIMKQIRALRDLENERNQANADYNKQIKDQKAVVYGLLDTKPTTRVRCKIEIDYKARVRRYLNDKTGEMVKEIALTEEEIHKQEVLPLDAPVVSETVSTAPSQSLAGMAADEGLRMDAIDADLAKPIVDDFGDGPGPGDDETVTEEVLQAAEDELSPAAD